MTFLGRLAAIVPHPRIHLTHYHGVVAPASAWRTEVVPDAPEATKARRSSWIPWASLLQRVFGVNPLVCASCGGRMVVRAVVERMGTAHKLLGVIAARVQAFTLLPFPVHTTSLALGP